MPDGNMHFTLLHGFILLKNQEHRKQTILPLLDIFYYSTITDSYSIFLNMKKTFASLLTNTSLARRISSSSIFNSIPCRFYIHFSTAHVDLGKVDARKVLRWTLNSVLQLGHLTSATLPKPLTPNMLPK